MYFGVTEGPRKVFNSPQGTMNSGHKGSVLSREQGS